MSYPRIYIGSTPPTPQARQTLRLRALDLGTNLRQVSESEPTYVLLNFYATDLVDHELIDLLLLRPGAAIVGVIKECNRPIDVLPNGQWIIRENNQQILGPHGETPLAQITFGRSLVLQQLERYNNELPAVIPDPATFSRTIGALICAPTTHPAMRVTLDVDDHRRQIKVLGLDELPALAAMVRTDVHLDEAAMRVIAAEVFGGRYWYDGERLLFELALAPFCLHVLPGVAQEERVLPLIEGANVIGRRETPVQHEYRLTIAGDDTMSNDHALLTCTADGLVILRDTSTNGTWLSESGAAEVRIHRAERAIVPGSILRMGVTQMRLEPASG